MLPRLITKLGPGFLAMLAALGTGLATDAEKLYLDIENRTSHRIDDIRLTSGEKFANEGTRTGLEAGLHTYGIAISVVSLGSNVHARLRGKDVIFRCSAPIEQRPKTENVTCVLTEEDGTCKAEYIRTPFAEFSESAPEILLPPDQIAVMGTVKRPGIFTLASDDRLTLEQALELAGGLHEGDWINSPAASPRNIRLHREVDGQKKTFKLDGSNVRGKRGTDLDFLVQPGDKIYVPYLF